MLLSSLQSGKLDDSAGHYRQDMSIRVDLAVGTCT